MGKLGTITRRTFLIGSAAIAGGVAFGYYQVTKELENPLKPGKGETTLNPYLLITKEGITIITPRAEMGQGVHTTLAALVAEELDVAWQDIKTMHGPASGTYYNEKVATLPYPEYKENSTKDKLENIMGAVGKIMGIQITGGSTSTRDAFEKMRLAGAAARYAMIEAAADKTGQKASTLKTKDGFVILPDGQKLSYLQLAPEAAKIPPPEAPKLKDPSEWRYLGKDMPRVDMVEKVTGTAEFGIDTKLEGMLFATIRMNPQLGAKMKSFDAKKAKEMPGVKKVVDLGDGIGVIANNTWQAFEAAKKITIEWEEAPYPPDTKAIFSQIEQAFNNEPNSTLRDDGDVNTALVPTKDIIKAQYAVPFLAHATMEPMNAVALLKDDKLTVWAGNQAPVLVRDHAAKVAGLNSEAVTVYTPYMGGGFGRRCEYDFSDLAVKMAMAMPGLPIKTTWSREEDMRHDFYRPGAIAHFEGRMGNDQPIALKADIASPSCFQQFSSRFMGMAPPGPDKILVEGSFDQPYAIEHYQVNGYISDIAVPLGPWRSVGNSYNGFFHECFLDELAASKNIDPVAMRLQLMKNEHEPSYKVLKAVAEMADWDKPLAKNKGRGVAFTYSFNTPVAQIIEISNSEDGLKVDKVWCALDVGTALDPRNIEAQMMSGIIYGLSAAIYGEITFENGQVVEGNFDSYDALRMATAPQIEVKTLQNKPHISGVGEPGTPPSMPALANAIFNLTGNRIRELPLKNAVEFA